MNRLGSLLICYNKCPFIINVNLVRHQWNRHFVSEYLVPSCSHPHVSRMGVRKLTTGIVVVGCENITSLTFILIRQNLGHSQPGYSSHRCLHTFDVCRTSFTMGKNNKLKQVKQHLNQTSNTGESESCGTSFVQDAARTNRSRKLVPMTKIPSKINLVVIGTGGPGASRSLLVTTEYHRYMFNCGEGTQRLTAMSKSLRVTAFAKLAGLEHFFFTHKSWENVGGLPGMAMTLEGHKNPDTKSYVTRAIAKQIQNSGNVPHITVHGPPGVENVALMAKKFAVQANMKIVRHEGDFIDTSLTITSVPIYKQMTETANNFKLDDSESVPAKRQRRDSQTLNDSDLIYAYICEAQPPIPKINVEKCHDVGVRIGPMVGCLQRGESVVLEDGRVVHPEQVTDVVPSNEKPFLIVECPSLDFLPSLQSSHKLQPYVGKSEKLLSVIVHMTSSHVFNSPQYQSWMKEFHDSTDHMVLNHEASEIDLIRVKDHQARLNLLSQEVFPPLPEVNIPETVVSTPGDVAESQGEGNSQARSESNAGRVVRACPGLHYVYRGKEGLGFQIETDESRWTEIQQECMDIPEIQEELTRLRQYVPSAAAENSDTDLEEECITKYPKITFLGTGSSEPNLIRAQSCIVVQVSKHSVIILDCGEDSYGQLYRFFGKTKTNQILRKIKAIFISHLHADHHLGLFSLLKERKIAFDEKNIPFRPVLLLAPVQIRRWLKFYHTQLEPVTELFRFVKHQEKLKDFVDGITIEPATSKDVLQELNLTEYKPVEVEHCHNAYGITITHANGFKLVYSGDTRPCDNLVTAGANCDLLIHEATHEDFLQEHAIVSKHSTFSEAINVGLRMKAKNIILTHFSQRYPYMVPLHEVKLPQNVGLAFDNMQVCPRTVRYLPHMIPALNELFAVELQRLVTRLIRRNNEEMENKAKQNS